MGYLSIYGDFGKIFPLELCNIFFLTWKVWILMINLHSHDFCGAGMNSSTSFILSALPDVVTFYYTRKGGTRFSYHYTARFQILYLNILFQDPDQFIYIFLCSIPFQWISAGSYLHTLPVPSPGSHGRVPLRSRRILWIWRFLADRFDKPLIVKIFFINSQADDAGTPAGAWIGQGDFRDFPDPAHEIFIRFLYPAAGFSFKIPQGDLGSFSKSLLYCGHTGFLPEGRFPVLLRGEG